MKRLDASPRHHEYITVRNAGQKVLLFVDYPQVAHAAPVIVMVHEIFGLTPWAKEMADEVAALGYIVVEPDLLTGMGPHGGNSDSFASEDAAVEAVSQLDPARVTTALNAAADYGKRLPSTSGSLAVMGFCWGGGESFRFATTRRDLAAAFVFYGPPPTDAALTQVTAPVYGFYAGNDDRITATVPATQAAMKRDGKTYVPVVYPGAGHGFMRAGESPDASPANHEARMEAFNRLTRLLHAMH